MQLVFDHKKAVEIILHVAQNAPCPDIYHVLKIIYFADKSHLQQYGRLLCDDSYVAMNNGPVPSGAYDIIKHIRGDGYVRFDDCFTEAFELQDHKICPLKDPELDLLSDSDIECLNEAIKEYGNLSFGKLKDLSHDEAFKSADQDDFISLEAIAGTLEDGDLLLKHLQE